MVVRQDEARLVDDEPRAGGAHQFLARLLTTWGVVFVLAAAAATATATAEEPVEQAVGIVAEELAEVARLLQRFGADVHHGRRDQIGDLPERRRGHRTG